MADDALETRASELQPEGSTKSALRSGGFLWFGNRCTKAMPGAGRAFIDPPVCCEPRHYDIVTIISW
jgi:hypothetical protein